MLNPVNHNDKMQDCMGSHDVLSLDRWGGGGTSILVTSMCADYGYGTSVFIKLNVGSQVGIFSLFVKIAYLPVPTY